MYTLGYSFKPWVGNKSLADGPSILKYLTETAEETGVTDHIHYGRKVLSARWDSTETNWIVTVQRTDGGEMEEWRGNFLLMCSGYYSYEKPYIPDFEGTDDYKGELFHAQHWPEDLDYAGKRVLVIGSGATAATLVPAGALLLLIADAISCMAAVASWALHAWLVARSAIVRLALATSSAVCWPSLEPA